MGSAFEALARYPKAAEAFDRAIAVATSEALLWQELAQVYIKLSQRERAMEALKRSLVFDPTVPQTHQLLGTLRMEEDSALAEGFFSEAIRIQPQYAQALTNLAILLAQRNRPDEAAYNFERLNYGLLLRNLGRVDEAKQHARWAASSSDGPTREAAGRLLIELGGH